MATVRRLFLDSRFAAGTPGDFTFQLPRDVATKRGQVLALGSISFPNHFETIQDGYNSILYIQKRSPPNAAFPGAQVSYNCAVRLTPGQYDGPAFATELARALSEAPGDLNVSVAYLQTKGAVRVTCSQDYHSLQIFRLEDLQNLAWVQNVWFSADALRVGETLVPGNLQAANGMVPSPQGLARQFDSFNLDLSGSLREVYVHSSVCDNGSLSSCGAMDVIAVIPLSEQWGAVINWRPFGPIDSQAVVLQDGALSTIRFYLTDAFNRPLPLTESFVFLELSILDVPTM